ncbi:hypothetical protein PAT3040_02795 [Paenibacillus agaridevorans]|uniref:Alkaline phosphatase family protein n=2 Tax=Paenibacillus agaridevorans TaxID=171404 RepID=A0A2R5EWQ1_9BACL|nr:hypothetical protein PAT3040_02795 [Paenibacillus agaridevorans]
MDRETKRMVEHYGEKAGGKEETVTGTTLYDAVKAVGGTTAAICWPKTRGAENIDYNIPEFYEQEAFETHCTPSLWKELRDAGLPVGSYGAWSKDFARGPMQDWLSTEAAKYMLRHKQPNLLLLHYLLPDSLQHQYGACSPELAWAAGYIDERIGDLLKTLKELGLEENTELFIMSDHGLSNAIRGVYPNVLFKRNGWFHPEHPELSQVRAVSNGGSAYVYVMEEDAAERSALMDKVLILLKQTEGIARIIIAGDMSRWGLPEEGECDRYRPDFVLEAKNDSFFNMGYEADSVIIVREKPVGMHGYFVDHPSSEAFFLAAGPSVRKGGKLPSISALDIAPTIAGLFGAALPETDGILLSELWRKVRS